MAGGSLRQPSRARSSDRGLPTRLDLGAGLGLPSHVPTTRLGIRFASFAMWRTLALRGGTIPLQTPGCERAGGLIKQPETRPISQEQLVAEVKGIYAGLVMVESKCIEDRQ